MTKRIRMTQGEKLKEVSVKAYRAATRLRPKAAVNDAFNMTVLAAIGAEQLAKFIIDGFSFKTTAKAGMDDWYARTGGPGPVANSHPDWHPAVRESFIRAFLVELRKRGLAD